MSDTAKKKLEKCFSAMVVDYPFYNFISYGFKVKECKVGTMATDMEHLYYDPEALDKWSTEEVMAVVLHEIIHCVFLHPSELGRALSKSKNQTLWTIAQEFVVNSEVYLACQGKKYKLPGSAMTIAKYTEGKWVDGNHCHDVLCADKSTSEVYDILVAAHKNAGKPLPQQSIMVQIGIGGGDEEGNSGKQVEGVKPGGAIDTLIPAKSGGAAESEMVERILGAMNVTKGNVSARTKEHIEKLKQSQVPWQRVLHRLIGKTVDPDEYRWDTPNFRHPLADQIVMPGLTSEKVNNVVVALDTSGSVRYEQLAQFATELVKMKTIVEEIDIYTSDCQIQETIKLREFDDVLKKVKMCGRGGTDFRPVFDAVAKKGIRPPILIYFTDGCGDYPEYRPGYPVLWVLTKEHSTPPFGQSVVLSL